jgi:hypothetical protein
MNVYLNSCNIVPKGQNMNNPVRSAGESVLSQTAALKGLNVIILVFSPFRAAIVVRYLPCVSHTVIQI